MQFFKDKTNFDFMGVRKKFGIISLVAVLLSLAGALIVGPKMGIDFAGGTEIRVSFEEPVKTALIRKNLKDNGFKKTDVVTVGTDNKKFLIRMQSISSVTDEKREAAQKGVEATLKDNKMSLFDLSEGGDKLTIRLEKKIPIAVLEKAVVDSGLPLGALDEEDRKKTEEAKEKEEAKHCESLTCTWVQKGQQEYEVNLKGVSEQVMNGFNTAKLGNGAKKERSEWIGPKVGKQYRDAGIMSIVIALAFIMLYIAIRFDLRFAPGAVVALTHDVIITVGIFTLLRVEVTLATIAALLTIVGYSLNDTIVVFDRIRENMNKIKERKLIQVINTSINETLSRTILTSITTLIVVVVILGLGWQTTIRDFAFALLIGVLVGTYSSVFVASPIVVWVDNRYSKKNV